VDPRAGLDILGKCILNFLKILIFKLHDRIHRRILHRNALLIIGIYIDSAVQVFEWSGVGQCLTFQRYMLLPSSEAE
jgi:hypothetical protein